MSEIEVFEIENSRDYSPELVRIGEKLSIDYSFEVAPENFIEAKSYLGGVYKSFSLNVFRFASRKDLLKAANVLAAKKIQMLNVSGL